MLYSYQKATSDMPSPGKVIPRYLKILPTIVSSLGLAMVASVVWPMASYNLSQVLNQSEDRNNLLSPIIYESFASESQPKFEEELTLIGEIDYTRASNWFTFSPTDSGVNALPGQSEFINLNEMPTPTYRPKGSKVIPPKPEPENEYQLAIPSLGIKTAIVRANTDDLTKSLVQYRQTSYPGELGAPVIFGHSTLPQFFRATNYLSIFSTLPTMKLGDDIFVDYAGVKYTYRVNKMYEVKPNEVWVLKQDYSNKSLKLITCVPPGTKLRRLVVEAELIKS